MFGIFGLELELLAFFVEFLDGFVVFSGGNLGFVKRICMKVRVIYVDDKYPVKWVKITIIESKIRVILRKK